MSEYMIINDLSEAEEAKLYKNLPPDIYNYVKVADMVNADWQLFFDVSNCVGITKLNDTVSLLEARDIAVLGFESTMEDYLQTAYVVEDLSVVERRDIDIVNSRFHNTPLFVLDTERCIVREHSIEDYEAICDIYSDETMTEYIEPLFEPEEERRYLQQYIDNIYKYFGFGLWLIVDKKDNNVIGRAGVEIRDTCFEDGQVELSYQVKKDYQNRGIATEVCGAIVEYTFNVLKMNTIIARVDDGNLASTRVIDKLGFRKLGDGKYIKKKDDSSGHR